jgi:hypothetical protein
MSPNTKLSECHEVVLAREKLDLSSSRGLGLKFCASFLANINYVVKGGSSRNSFQTNIEKAIKPTLFL